MPKKVILLSSTLTLGDVLMIVIFAVLDVQFNVNLYINYSFFTFIIQ